MPGTKSHVFWMKIGSVESGKSFAKEDFAAWVASRESGVEVEGGRWGRMISSDSAGKEHGNKEWWPEMKE